MDGCLSMIRSHYISYKSFVNYKMPTVPIISQQTKDALARKGYDGTAVFEVNKLPEFAIPRTTACILFVIQIT